MAIYDSSVSANFLQQLFAGRTKNYMHVISMYDPKKEYFSAGYDSSHLPCYVPIAEQPLDQKTGLPSDNRKTILPHVILHQPVTGEIADPLIEQKVSKLPSDYRAWFVTLFTTDVTGKRTAKNTIDPLAIVADYDRGIEPPTNARLIELSLPLPTVRVQSGGGYHLWWFLTEDSCTKEQRLEIMLGIIEKTGADPAMKDEARVLRVPGSIHLKNPADPKVVTIIEANYDRRFTQADFDTFVIANLPTPIPTTPKLSPPYTSQSNSSSYISPIPIERCLSKAHREALTNGVSDGNRDNMGCALARDLIGCASFVPNLEFDYSHQIYQLQVDGDPESLLWDYCQRCSPALNRSDCDRIYKSAQDFNPAPSISDVDALKNCLRSWVKDNLTKPSDTKQNQAKKRKKPGHDYNLNFRSTPEDGLFVIVKKIDPETGAITELEHYIGDHLIGIADVDSPDANQAGIYLEFKDYNGKTRNWLMPRSSTIFESAQMLAELLNRKYSFKISRKKELIEYLNGLGADIDQTYTITEQTGWVNKTYVSQNKTYSIDNKSDLKFRDIEPIADSISEIKGTLAEWQTHVGAKCVGNSRLIFAIGVALAAPLQPLLGIESGGFHLVGETSKGKTTVLKIASSVVGIKDIPQWRTTINGLEAIAYAHNHLLLPLDEIGLADDKDVGSIAYMLANGQGKTRMTKNLTNRKAKTWQLLFLSSGEYSLAQYMALGGVSQKGGQEVRLPDIPALCSGSPHGIFETIHDCESSKDLVERLDAATHKYRGTLLNAFLERLVVDVADDLFLPKLRNRLREIAIKLATGTTDNAVSRVSNRFALVQVALELAHSYGLLLFPLVQIEWAIQKMFVDWLNSRGGDGSIEMRSAINRIQHLLITNEFSDRIYTLPDNSDRVVRNLLGYRKLDTEGSTEEFWIPPSVFEKEICENMNKLELIKELQRVGLMIPARKDGSPKHQRQLNKKNSYYFILKPSKTSEGSEGSEDLSSNDLIPAVISLQEPSALPSASLQVLKAEEEEPTFRTFNLPEGCLKAFESNESLHIYGLESLSSEPSEPSDTFTLFKKSEEFVNLPLNKDDIVVLTTTKAVGLVISNRTKKLQTLKGHNLKVNQCLVEFEDGDRKWLDADVLVLTQKIQKLEKF